MYSDKEFRKAQADYKHLPPTSKEALHYRKLFEKYYGKGEIAKVVPYFWLPLWSGKITDPSARILKVYTNSDD